MFKHVIEQFVVFEPASPPSREKAEPVQAEIPADTAIEVKLEETPYTKLRRSAEALKAFIPEEPQRLKAALAAIAAEGILKKDIIEAIDSHLISLQNLEKQYDTQYTQSSHARVESKNDEKKTIVREILELQNQLKDKQLAHDDLTKTIGTMVKQIEAARKAFEEQLSTLRHELTKTKTEIAALK